MIYPIVLGKGVWQCVQCGYTGKRKTRIKEHLQKLGPLHNKECTQCSKKMASYKQYQDHVNKQHFGVWKYSCGFENCAEMFDNAKKCKNHTMIAHRQHELKPKKEKIRKPKPSNESILIFCDQCGKDFKSKSNYSYHMHYHHSKTDLKKICPHCNKIEA